MLHDCPPVLLLLYIMLVYCLNQYCLHNALSTTREMSPAARHVDYLCRIWVYFEAYSRQLSDTPLHIAECRFKIDTDCHVIEIPDAYFVISDLLRVRPGEGRSGHHVGHLTKRLSIDLKQ